MSDETVTLFLGGDVMTGRGVDQILAHPGDPTIYEPWLRSAAQYLDLAERAAGSIPRSVPPTYIWGDAIDELARAAPDVRIVNLETAVTTHPIPWPGKSINYRMHPANIDAVAAGADCCTLANNHVLDWSTAGLVDTLDALAAAGIATTGAGIDTASAWTPAAMTTKHGRRVVVLGVGARSSGIPAQWTAAADRPGLAVLSGDVDTDVAAVAESLTSTARPGDVTVVSIHWGGNWGYDIPGWHRRLARALVEAGVDVVHGHSSHHPLGIEVYRDRLVLYGCGDFINDYEGISGYEGYRSDLHVLYLPVLDAASARLVGMGLIPMRMRRFRLELASEEATTWLEHRLDRECRKLGTSVERSGNRLQLRWAR